MPDLLEMYKKRKSEGVRDISGFLSVVSAFIGINTLILRENTLSKLGCSHMYFGPRSKAPLIIGATAAAVGTSLWIRSIAKKNIERIEEKWASEEEDEEDVAIRNNYYHDAPHSWYHNTPYFPGKRLSIFPWKND